MNTVRARSVDEVDPGVLAELAPDDRPVPDLLETPCLDSFIRASFAREVRIDSIAMTSAANNGRPRRPWLGHLRQ